MGWSGGSEVMDGIIDALKSDPNISERSRYKAYKKIIPVLEGRDWDTQGECLKQDPAYDRALKDCDPEWFEEMFGEGYVD